MNSVLTAVFKARQRRAQQTNGDADNVLPAAKSAIEESSLWAGARIPLLIFLMLSAAIGAIGYFTYAYQKQVLQTDKQAELTAIADTKVQRIADWMNERRGDARVLSNDPFLALAVQRCSQNESMTTANPTESPRLLARLTHLKEAYGYRSVALLSPGGETLRCAGDFPDDPHLPMLVARVQRSGDVVVFDLHRDAPAEPIEMTVLAPLTLNPEQTDEAVGLVYLRIDPERYLFPLIQTWPLPSRSAETLLVREEGDEVVFLNELRHRQNTALNLRLPVSEPSLPAAMAVNGQQGIVQGLDYREVEVLAAIRAVPSMPWFLVAKVDVAEIYEPVDQVALLVSMLVSVFILFAGSGVILWWRQQQALFLADHFRNELERKALVRHFDYLTRYANDIVLLTDAEGRLVESNDRALMAYGLSRAELQQRTIRDLHAPSRQAQNEKQLAQIEKSDGMIYETLHQRRDGSPFPVEVSARAMEIDGQRFFQHIIRDISERQRLIKRSERQARILDAVLSATPDQVWMQDRAGLYLYGNAAALRTVNRHQADKIVGKTGHELGLPNAVLEACAAQIQQVFATGRGSTQQVTLATAAGTQHYEYLFSPIAGESGKFGDLYAVVITVRDLTEYRQAEEQLKQRQAEQAHVNRVTTLGEMASGMAHELNQPLTAITHYCEAALMLLRAGATSNIEKLIQVLEKTAGQALRAGEIVRHLRDFVRKDTSGWESLDINALVSETLEFVAAEARFQNVTTALALNESLPQLHGDRVQLQQVLVNLLHNAIEAMEQAESPVRQLAVSTALNPEQRIQVTVRDTGPGLAPEIAESLFQRFQTTKASGIGLGLSISRSIIEAHGGRLWAEPNAGQGAVFCFTLPLLTEE